MSIVWHYFYFLELGNAVPSVSINTGYAQSHSEEISYREEVSNRFIDGLIQATYIQENI